MVSGMDKHIRFHIDLSPMDAKLLNILILKRSEKSGEPVSRPTIVRLAIRAMAKKERIA